jgi:hypothetical protein
VGFGVFRFFSGYFERGGALLVCVLKHNHEPKGGRRENVVSVGET